MNTGMQLGAYKVHSRMIQVEENRWGFKEALKLEKVDCWQMRGSEAERRVCRCYEGWSGRQRLYC